MNGESTGPATKRTDVNNASAEELSAQVAGIGAELAQRIVDYREGHGPITSLEQLVQVRGIGQQSLRRLASQLALGGALAAEQVTPEAETEPGRPEAEESVQVAAEAGQPPIEMPEDAAEATDAVSEAVGAVAIETAEDVAETPERVVDPVEETATVAQAAFAETMADSGDALDQAATLAAEELADGATEAADSVAADEGAEAGWGQDDLAQLDEEQAAMQTAEEVSRLAAEDLKTEVAEVEMKELGLYTRAKGSDPLTTWAPPVGALDEELAEESESAAPTMGAAEPGPVPESAETYAAEATPAEVLATEVGQASAAQVSQVGAIEEKAMAQEAATMAGPVRIGAEEAKAQPERSRGGFWRGLGLVLLGGLLGVALTVLGAMVWSGTFDYAPRQEVDALNRNLNTMQANQELAWERVDQLTLSSEEMARKVKQIESFTGRIGDMETGLAAAERGLAEAKKGLGDLSKSVVELETSLETSMNKLDDRVTTTEDQLGTMSSLVASLEESFAVVEDRVQNIDGFFGSLRDLLINLEGPAPTPAKEGGAKVPEPPAAKTDSSNR